MKTFLLIFLITIFSVLAKPDEIVEYKMEDLDNLDLNLFDHGNGYRASNLEKYRKSELLQIRDSCLILGVYYDTINSINSSTNDLTLRHWESKTELEVFRNYRQLLEQKYFLVHFNNPTLIPQLNTASETVEIICSYNHNKPDLSLLFTIDLKGTLRRHPQPNNKTLVTESSSYQKWVDKVFAEAVENYRQKKHNKDYSLINVKFINVDDGLNLVKNGQFEIEKPSLYELQFTPTSKKLDNWTVEGGIVGIRLNGSEDHALELGPRQPPGSIKQTIPTTPDLMYKLTFSACTGRDLHSNSKIRVIAGSVNEVVTVPNGTSMQSFAVDFKATEENTELKFTGIGDASFGPILDRIRIISASQ